LELPQAAKRNTRHAAGGTGAGQAQDECMTSVYLADGQTVERSALRLMLQDLKMIVVGEAADWATTLAEASATHPDMLLVDFSLIPGETGTALAKMRLACPGAIVIILHSQLDACQQAELSAGADGFISKGESPERVAEHLRGAARSVRSDKRTRDRS
jgi:DNA-binding NarL/FixJ family response regulator